ncbi:MAG: hypothetical protein HPY89_02900 [Pelotomaculum sp.]|uniref:Uncharacterized protein n=1 Tax=Pelotomaculum thermopropionicum (strain DSM 13744 / JCM 10971 / SI) TaxID=370438 RepID=A5D181_PELTS|nr:hypothetical protein [Pelotomaculum sp.]BAF60003.1 hypothetical protein PTH_1822 [Pelotomaculum thermopropionicum SI]
MLEVVYQRNWFCSVRGMPAGDLLAETTLLRKEVEAAGRLIIGKRSGRSVEVARSLSARMGRES